MWRYECHVRSSQVHRAHALYNARAVHPSHALQESHTVKAGGAQQSQACVSLAADRRCAPINSSMCAVSCLLLLPMACQ